MGTLPPICQSARLPSPLQNHPVVPTAPPRGIPTRIASALPASSGSAAGSTVAAAGSDAARAATLRSTCKARGRCQHLRPSRGVSARCISHCPSGTAPLAPARARGSERCGASGTSASSLYGTQPGRYPHGASPPPSLPPPPSRRPPPSRARRAAPLCPPRRRRGWVQRRGRGPEGRERRRSRSAPGRRCGRRRWRREEARQQPRAVSCRARAGDGFRSERVEMGSVEGTPRLSAHLGHSAHLYQRPLWA